MPAAPAMPIQTISPGEMQLLLSRAGLVLNPGQVADLVLAWRQIVGLIASISHDRPLADDMALMFRLPPAAGVTAAPAVVAPAAKGKAQRKAQAKAQGKSQGKAQGRSKPKTKAKPAAGRRTARSPSGKGAHRGR